MTDTKLQRVNLWAAVAGLLFTGIGFFPLARLIPPHPPSNSAEEIVAFWAENTDIKRLGVISLLIGLGLAIALPVAIFIQMRRVGGPSSPLPWLQLCAGLLSYAPGFICFLSWEVLAFRPDRGDPAFVLGLNDLAWFSFMTTTVAWVQAMAIALCAFQDKGTEGFSPLVGLSQFVGRGLVCAGGIHRLFQARSACLEWPDHVVGGAGGVCVLAGRDDHHHVQGGGRRGSRAGCRPRVGGGRWVIMPRIRAHRARSGL